MLKLIFKSDFKNVEILDELETIKNEPPPIPAEPRKSLRRILDDSEIKKPDNDPPPPAPNEKEESLLVEVNKENQSSTPKVLKAPKKNVDYEDMQVKNQPLMVVPFTDQITKKKCASIVVSAVSNQNVRCSIQQGKSLKITVDWLPVLSKISEILRSSKNPQISDQAIMAHSQKVNRNLGDFPYTEYNVELPFTAESFTKRTIPVQGLKQKVVIFDIVGVN